MIKNTPVERLLTVMNRLEYRGRYRRNLPHHQPPGAVLFVTFRLTGSLPASVRNYWHQERRWIEKLVQRNDPRAVQAQRRWFAKFDAVLDKGATGPLWLKDEASHII